MNLGRTGVAGRRARGGARAATEAAAVARSPAARSLSAHEKVVGLGESILMKPVAFDSAHLRREIRFLGEGGLKIARARVGGVERE
eukprot:1424510-Pleurochrysis_carterae.AAC.2